MASKKINVITPCDKISSGEWFIIEHDSLFNKNSIAKTSGIFITTFPLNSIKEVQHLKEEKSGLFGKSITFNISFTDGNTITACANQETYQTIFSQQNSSSKLDLLVSKSINPTPITIVIAFFATFWFMSGEYKHETNTGDVSSSSQNIISASSIEIAKAYEDNEAQADSIYKNAVILVQGKVDSIDLDAADNTVVMLQGVNEFLPVHAEVKDSRQELDIAKRLKKGQKTTLKCIGKGEIIGAPMLDECTFE